MIAFLPVIQLKYNSSSELRFVKAFDASKPQDSVRPLGSIHSLAAPAKSSDA
jgi:hypothetical protein